jgi:hypothetical protein
VHDILGCVLDCTVQDSLSDIVCTGGMSPVLLAHLVACQMEVGRMLVLKVHTVPVDQAGGAMLVGR